MRQVVAGIRQGLRSWRTTLLFGGMVAVGIYALAASLGMAAMSTKFVEGSAVLRDRDAVFFSANYLRTEPIVPSPELREVWGSAVDSGVAYTTIQNNYPHREVTPYTVLVVVGGFEEVYGFDPVDGSEPAVLLGSDVAAFSVGDVVDLGPHSAPAVSRLPSDSGYIDPWSGYRSLDRTIVLKLDAESLATVRLSAQEEAVSRTVFLGESGSIIDDFVQRAWETRLQLIPLRSTDPEVGGWSSFLAENYTGVVLYTVFMMITILGFWSVAGSVGRASRRRLAVERLYGATLSQLTVRQFTYVASVLFVPAVVIVTSLSLLLPDLKSIAPWLILTMFMVTCALCARVMHVVAQAGIANQIRERNL